jgi:uncharacterized protein (DUF1684 family)
MKKFTLLLFLAIAECLQAQKPTNYVDSLKAFRTHYVDNNEAVKGSDRKFMQFFPIDSSYRVIADFVRLENSPWFDFNTSGKNKQVFRRYGELHFAIDGKPLRLYAYQSQYFLGDKKYTNYLFAPFTDSTSAEETYGAGRYLDISILDIKDNKIIIDFNKAYNPLCAYSHDWECPLPPRENDLAASIKAGEKTFGKQVH